MNAIRTFCVCALTSVLVIALPGCCTNKVAFADYVELTTREGSDVLLINPEKTPSSGVLVTSHGDQSSEVFSGDKLHQGGEADVPRLPRAADGNHWMTLAPQTLNLVWKPTQTPGGGRIWLPTAAFWCGDDCAPCLMGACGGGIDPQSLQRLLQQSCVSISRTLRKRCTLQAGECQCDPD